MNEMIIAVCILVGLIFWQSLVFGIRFISNERKISKLKEELRLAGLKISEQEEEIDELLNTSDSDVGPLKEDKPIHDKKTSFIRMRDEKGSFVDTVVSEKDLYRVRDRKLSKGEISCPNRD